MSTLFVDTINEKTSGNGVAIPGHVVQVVHAENETGVTLSSNSLADTGVSLSITPQFSNSKILVSFKPHFLLKGNAHGVRFAIYRSIAGGADIYIEQQPQDYANYFRPGGSGTMQYRGYSNLEKLDSPATTSSIEYKLYADYHTGNSAELNNGGTTYLTLMEIAQ